MFGHVVDKVQSIGRFVEFETFNRIVTCGSAADILTEAERNGPSNLLETTRKVPKERCLKGRHFPLHQQPFSRLPSFSYNLG
jgi:hypothetical protein